MHTSNQNNLHINISCIIYILNTYRISLLLHFDILFLECIFENVFALLHVSAKAYEAVAE